MIALPTFPAGVVFCFCGCEEGKVLAVLAMLRVSERSTLVVEIGSTTVFTVGGTGMSV